MADSGGTGPIAMAVFAGAVVVAGAILINGCAQRNVAAREADTALILKAINTDPVQAGKNLSFLVKSEVISSKKQRDKLAEVIKTTRSRGGPALAAADDNSKCPMPLDARSDLGQGWLNIGCDYWFPPYEGFDGPQEDTELKAEARIDRYGGPHGTFLSPALPPTPYDKRALPYDPTKPKLYTYKVLKPFKVKEGLIAPWFDKPGGGTQYKTAKPVRDLVAEKFLEDITPK